MIKIYTTNTCAYCALVKRYLTSRGKEYQVVNLDDDPAERQRLFALTGAMTVPITEHENKFIIGWQPAKLAALV